MLLGFKRLMSFIHTSNNTRKCNSYKYLYCVLYATVLLFILLYIQIFLQALCYTPSVISIVIKHNVSNLYKMTIITYDTVMLAVL